MSAGQESLFDYHGAPNPRLRFDGDTAEAQDHQRLTGLLLAVRELMADGEWRTLGQIVRAVGGSEASVSARLRDLRKPRFGGLRVDRRRVVHGLFEYRVQA